MSVSFPIFNLRRGDLPWTLLVGVIFTCVGIVLLQGSSPQDSLFKHIFIVSSAITASAFFGLALAKTFCGYGNFCDFGEQEKYQNIEQDQKDSEGRNSQHSSTRKNVTLPEQETLLSTQIQSNGAVIAARDETRQQSRGASLVSNKSHYTPEQHVGPGAEREIHCGIEIARAIEPFQHNGILHPKGSLRITRVLRDGVSERQGACTVGDVLLNVDGRDVLDLDIDHIRKLLRGKAGDTVMLKLHCDASHEPVTRHVILAPAPVSGKIPVSGLMLTSSDAALKMQS